MLRNKVKMPREIVAKAIDALYRYTQSRGLVFQQPEGEAIGKTLGNGHIEFNLSNIRGVLATYLWTGKRVVRVSP
jgi:hypothetical protein